MLIHEHRMKYRLKQIYRKDGQDKLLPRLGVFVYDHSRAAVIVWLCLLLFGVASYTTFLKRQGFPSISIPLSIVSGSYLVNDPAKVDADVAKPLSDIILKNSHVTSVQAQSRAAFYAITVQYADGTDTVAANRELQTSIAAANALPKQATVKVESPKFGFSDRGDDLIISTYLWQPGFSQQALKVEAQRVVAYVQDQHIDDIQSISVIDPYIAGINPKTGQQTESQTYFDRYGSRQDDKAAFYQSISIGLTQKKGSDVIKLNNKLQKALDAYNAQYPDSSFHSVISASYATDITAQISELQRALFEGLIAVLIIGSIIIAIRASLITVVSMLTVLAITAGILYLVGYSLNTITLFALILCLGLVVDDTIIMVEAIDAQRRRLPDPRQIIRIATQKVSRAMVAATLTAALSFAPLIFTGGVLGSFIRAIPITVITSLLVSLTVALVFIPLFARFLLLGKKQLGEDGVSEPAARVEARIAKIIAMPMVWAQHSRKKLVVTGMVALIIGSLFIGAGAYLFQKVTFNIFPPSKDTNGLVATLRFPPGTALDRAEATVDRADDLIAQKLGPNFRTASYYENASDQSAKVNINLIPYNKRDVHSPVLRDQLTSAFVGFKGAQVDIIQKDVGPPPSDFSVQIQTSDRTTAYRLAKDLDAYLLKASLVRSSGEKAHIKEVTISDPGSYTRKDNKLFISVTANFDATDTTTLVMLAKSAVQKEFTANKLASYNLPKNALNFDIGQEQDNQDSFKTLALAFPILLFVIYLLLALQFRSLFQPLLIFMAIPFSIFGITLGLYLTDNAFSFFAMLGFFALIGLSLKNTILLTDYANQLRRTGASAVDAAVGALHERFRPLIATSLTAVVSLIPLAVMSPFWEGLAVVLIAGLLSSTFLVITVFPYYYLGAEFVRLRVSRTAALSWLAVSIALVAGLVMVDAPVRIIALMPLVTLIAWILYGRMRRTSRVRKARA
jgi:multidrug efflux pump subunit AcrB